MKKEKCSKKAVSGPKGSDPEKVRAKRLRELFNLTPKDFDSILQHQGNQCPISGKPSNKYVVDHCHKTGLIRGILDWKVNRALESFRDDPAALRRAADYLENPPAIKALGEAVYGALGSVSRMVKNRRYGPFKTKTPHPRSIETQPEPSN